MTKQTDEEKIKAASDEHCLKNNCPSFYPQCTMGKNFKSGVAWRDQNPSPKVQMLIEASTESLNAFQWVTNGIKMNERQHIILGDNIAGLYDALSTFKALSQNSEEK